MNAFASRAANAYARIGVETGVVSASPQQLISMLYQGAIAAIASAQQHLRLNNIAARGEAISKAISIIDDGLKASLDLKVGGDLAQNLFDLYTHMSQRLLYANLNSDGAALDAVAQLLQQLGSAWQTLAAKQVATKSTATPRAATPGTTPPPRAARRSGVALAATAQTNPMAFESPGQAQGIAATDPAHARGAAAVNPTLQQSRVAAAYGVR